MQFSELLKIFPLSSFPAYNSTIRCNIRCKNNSGFYSHLLLLLIILFNVCCVFRVSAQTCPQNIDFETGTFDGWTCYTGTVAAVGNQNVISLSPSGGPVYNRHTMYNSNSRELDYFGGFPVLCPNGSGHSIRLGSTTAGGQAEGASYEFTIPANKNSYSLVYHYAVVFQSPNHRPNEQPRMEIEITNVTDNTVISCASFTFISIGTALPGFLVSNESDSTAVLYKDWSAVSVDLSGNAGKTIRLFFKTADCTFRRHFGYAYIDVDSECSGNFVGATYCPDDTIIKVTAPYGYQDYTWYDSSLTNILGAQQVLTVSPPPLAGTTLAVKLEPYSGYGCPTTLFTDLIDSLTITANAGQDTLSCNLQPVSLGTMPKPGLLYKWTPAAGLSDPYIANPVAVTGTTTAYIVTTNNSGGGCRTQDTVIVRAATIDTSLQLIGKAAFCLGYGDSAILRVKPVQNIQWVQDDVAIHGAYQTDYRVTTSGTYYAVLNNEAGCSVATQKQAIIIDKAEPGIAYPTKYAVINVPLTLNARLIGDSVVWRPAVSLNTAASFTPVFKGALERLYTIDITTKTGCLTVDTQLVKTIKDVEIYVPTGFTPNGDGKNDFLHPLLKGVKEILYFRIFSRWGQLLYEMKNDQRGWDGTYRGVPQETQAIVWMLECTGVDDVVYLKKGTTVLIR